jgi:hypothetical protein
MRKRSWRLGLGLGLGGGRRAGKGCRFGGSARPVWGIISLLGLTMLFWSEDEQVERNEGIGTEKKKKLR